MGNGVMGRLRLVLHQNRIVPREKLKCLEAFSDRTTEHASHRCRESMIWINSDSALYWLRCLTVTTDIGTNLARLLNRYAAEQPEKWCLRLERFRVRESHRAVRTNV